VRTRRARLTAHYTPTSAPIHTAPPDDIAGPMGIRASSGLGDHRAKAGTAESGSTRGTDTVVTIEALSPRCAGELQIAWVHGSHGRASGADGAGGRALRPCREAGVVLGCR
jgi:hypothetical protein